MLNPKSEKKKMSYEMNHLKYVCALSYILIAFPFNFRMVFHITTSLLARQQNFTPISSKCENILQFTIDIPFKSYYINRYETINTLSCVVKWYKTISYFHNHANGFSLCQNQVNFDLTFDLSFTQKTAFFEVLQKQTYIISWHAI